MSFTFEFTAYFHRLAFHNTCGNRQGLHLERIRLLYFHFIRTGGQQQNRQTQEQDCHHSGQSSFFIHCIHILSDFNTLYFILYLQELMLQVFVQVLVTFVQRGTIHQFIRIAFTECLQRAPSGFIPIQITVDPLVPVKNRERAFQQ